MKCFRSIMLVLPCALITAASAQGPLAPSGPPAAGMKTLTQVEPRTPISSVPITLNRSGSYYLTTNLNGTAGSNGIILAANNIALDLNGFTLNGGSGSLNGIITSGGGLYYNVTVKNGIIQNWGDCGIELISTDSAVVTGIFASSNKTDGIRVGNNCTVRDCQIQANLQSGIYAYEGSSIRDCVVRDCGDDGIEVRSFNTVAGNLCINNGTSSTGAGIRATHNGNVIKNNNIQNNRTGLQLDGNDNEIAGNTVLLNTDNYTIAPYNKLNILLCDLPVDIDWPAHVELAGTLYGSEGINIRSDDVTIDLGGHALIGTGGSSGILVTDNVYNVTIRNGSIRDWLIAGIDAYNADNCILSDLKVFNITGDGIRVGSAAVVSKCVAMQCTGDGINVNRAGVITECSAWDNGGTGIECGYGGTVMNCSSRENSQDGFRIGNYSTISGCSASENSANGILAGDFIQIFNNNCNYNESGIRVEGFRGRVEANTVSLNFSFGLDINGGNNLIVRNSASANGADYSIAAGNGFAGQAIATGTFTNLNPWINFRF